MSGRSKRSLYLVFRLLVFAAAIAGCVVLAYFAIRGKSDVTNFLIAVSVFGLCFFVLPLSVFVHESGHLFCGAISGMRFVSVTVFWLKITRRGIGFAGKRAYNGETVMLPKSEKGARCKTVFFALGGALFNFIYGVVFLTLYFLCPVTPALLFFELFAPFNLCEGLFALFPVELPAGKTDGAVILGLLKNLSEERVTVSVGTAQGMLYSRSYRQIPRELLFNLPVVREDGLNFLALTQLRWQYLFMNGDEAGATEQIRRMETLIDYLSDEEMIAEIACDLAYGYAVFFKDCARAEEYFGKTKRLGDACCALRAKYAVYGEGKDPALKSASREKSKGIRELEESLIARVGK